MSTLDPAFSVQSPVDAISATELGSAYALLTLTAQKVLKEKDLNRVRVFLFSIPLLLGLVIGCAAPLAGPIGPDSSLVIGRVVINNQFAGRESIDLSSGTLPLRTIEEFIEVEIKSIGGNRLINASTGRGGYFMVPNIPPNTYNLRSAFYKSEDQERWDTVTISLFRMPSFTPVPGKILNVGTYAINVSKNSRVNVVHGSLDPEAARSHLSEVYQGTPWLKWKFAGGAVTERVQLPLNAYQAFSEYQSNPKFNDFKAFAVDPSSGAWQRSWGKYKPKRAIDRALRRCRERGRDCKLYAVGNTVVSGMSPEQVATVTEEYHVKIAEAAGFSRNKFHLSPIPEVGGKGVTGQRLSSDQINSYFSGSTVIVGITTIGRRFVLRRSPDGTMSAKAGSLTDTGTWWVKDDKFCVQWKRWVDGKRYCLIILKEGEVFRTYDSKGDIRSRFTITERAKVPES